MNTKIGILGGSFDPIHQGHLNIAQNAYQEFQLQEIWFVPAGHSPNKRESSMTPAEIRAKMVSLAIEDIPYFKLSTVEIDAPDTSYTYLTLSRFKEHFPQYEFYFIMGADSLDYFEKWVHPEIICQNAVILTAIRDDMDRSVIQNKIAEIQKMFPAEIYPISGEKTDISSSEIRTTFQSNQDEVPLIPVKVADYIKSHHLYEANEVLRNGSK